jgi:hypothetical protein
VSGKTVHKATDGYWIPFNESADALASDKFISQTAFHKSLQEIGAIQTVLITDNYLHPQSIQSNHWMLTPRRDAKTPLPPNPIASLNFLNKIQTALQENEDATYSMEALIQRINQNAQVKAVCLSSEQAKFEWVQKTTAAVLWKTIQRAGSSVTLEMYETFINFCKIKHITDHPHLYHAIEQTGKLKAQTPFSKAVEAKNELVKNIYQDLENCKKQNFNALSKTDLLEQEKKVFEAEKKNNKRFILITSVVAGLVLVGVVGYKWMHPVVDEFGMTDAVRHAQLVDSLKWLLGLIAGTVCINLLIYGFLPQPKIQSQADTQQDIDALVESLKTQAHEAFNEQINEKEVEIGQLKNTIALISNTLSTQLEASKSEIVSLQSSVEDLKMNTVALKQQLNDKNSTIKQVHGKATLFQMNLNEAQAKNQKLEVLIKEERFKRTVSETEIEKLKAILESQTDEIILTKTKMGGLKTKIESLEGTIKHGILQSLVSELKIVGLTKELKIKTEQITVFERNMDSLEKQLQVKKEDIAFLETKLYKQFTEFKEQERKIHFLNSVLTDLNNQIALLKSNDNRTIMLLSMRTSINKLENDLKMERNQLDGLNEAKRQLEMEKELLMQSLEQRNNAIIVLENKLKKTEQPTILYAERPVGMTFMRDTIQPKYEPNTTFFRITPDTQDLTKGTYTLANDSVYATVFKDPNNYLPISCCTHKGIIKRSRIKNITEGRVSCNNKDWSIIEKMIIEYN